MKQIKWISYSLLTLVLISLLFFLYSFGYSSLRNITIQSVDHKLSELEKERASFENLQQSYEDWKKIRESYDHFKSNYLMDFIQFPSFREELVRMMRSASLNTKSISHKYKEIFESLVKVDIYLKVLGPYGNIKKFVHQLETLDKMVIIKSLDLNKSNSGGGESSMHLEGYFVR